MTEKIKNIIQTTVSPKKNTAAGYYFYMERYDHISIDPYQIMFDSFWGRKIGCHPYAIYKKIKEIKAFFDYKFIWVREEGIGIPFDVLNDDRVSFVEYGSEEYAKGLLSSSILISNSNFSPYFSPKKEQYVVSTWHGIPMKTLGYDANPNLESVYNTQRNFNISNLVISSGQYFTEKVVESYGSYLALDSVDELGSPRIDLTLKANTQQLKAMLAVPNERKILLYAPTWRGKIGEVSNDLEIQMGLIKLLEAKYSDEYEIFVSLHHLTKKALGNIEKLKITEVPDSIDINEFLSVCDVLISDYSSIYLDYLVLNKPVILYIPDIDLYEKNRGLYLHPQKLPVNVAKSLDSFNNIFLNLKVPSSFDTYEEVRSLLLPKEDGFSADRAVQKIINRHKFSEKDTKKHILISVGGMKSNGITQSLYNLLKNINYDKFRIHLLINCKLMDADLDRKKNLDRLDQRCNKILTIAPKNFSKKQKQIYSKLEKGGEVTELEELTINAAFERESKRLFGSFVFDAVIDYTGYSFYWTSLLAMTSAKERIIFQHSDMYAEAHNQQKKHDSLFGVFKKYKYFDKLVSVSDEVLDINKSLLKEYVSEDRFISLPNLICVEDIYLKSKALLSTVAPSAFLLSLEKDLIKFVCVARLSQEKGHIRLLKSFQKVILSGVNASLSIVGSGVMEKELRQLCQTLSIEDRVVFHGYLENPYPIIKASSCLVLASDYEGQGLVFLEAMTLGVPCIGSDIPVIRNLITQYNGIVAPLEIGGLSKALIDFCNEPKPNITFDPIKYVDKSMNILYDDILHFSVEDRCVLDDVK